MPDPREEPPIVETRPLTWKTWLGVALWLASVVASAFTRSIAPLVILAFGVSGAYVGSLVDKRAASRRDAMIHGVSVVGYVLAVLTILLPGIALGACWIAFR